MTHCFGGHLRIGVSAIAGGEQTLAAEPAVATADRERHHNPVADPEVGNLGAECHDLAHVLVTEDVARLHRRLVAVEQVEVRPADRAGGDLDDRIARMLDLRVGYGVYSDIAFAVPAECAHDSSPCEQELRQDRKSD